MFLNVNSYSALAPRATDPNSWLVVSNIFVAHSWDQPGLEADTTSATAKTVFRHMAATSCIE